jgi:ABC-type transport system involved in multi-copper enzyme maturation permease subunit
MKQNLGQHLRILGAITAKDMVEAVRNRTTLSAILISMLMVFLYRSLPVLTSDSAVSNLLVYDAGSTSYWDVLEDSTEINVHGPYPTERLMIHDMTTGVTPELGIVIPEDFDQQVSGGIEVELMGYVMNWVRDEDVSELVNDAEGLFARVIGHPIRIITAGNEVYPQGDKFGYPMLYSIGVVIGVLMLGMIMTPNLMLEERKAKTMDALLVSPVRSAHLVIGKALTGIFYCMILVLIAAIFSGGLILHWWLFIVAGVVGSLFSVAVGLLFGTLFKTRQQMSVWVFFFSFPLMLPLFLTWMEGLIPETVIAVLKWIPTVAMGRIFRVSFTESADLSNYGLAFVVVFVSAVVVLAIVGWVLRRSDR